MVQPVNTNLTYNTTSEENLTGNGFITNNAPLSGGADTSLEDQDIQIKNLLSILYEKNDVIKSLKLKNKRLNMQKKRLENKYLKLEQKCDKKVLIESSDATLLKSYKRHLIKLQDGLENNEIGAIFLHKQLCSYKKAVNCWDEQLLRYCTLWRARSKVAYEFVRELKLLNLPCRDTLTRYVEFQYLCTYLLITLSLNQLYRQ